MQKPTDGRTDAHQTCAGNNNQAPVILLSQCCSEQGTNKIIQLFIQKLIQHIEQRTLCRRRAKHDGKSDLLTPVEVQRLVD